MANDHFILLNTEESIANLRQQAVNHLRSAQALFKRVNQIEFSACGAGPDYTKIEGAGKGFGAIATGDGVNVRTCVSAINALINHASQAEFNYLLDFIDQGG